VSSTFSHRIVVSRQRAPKIRSPIRCKCSSNIIVNTKPLLSYNLLLKPSLPIHLYMYISNLYGPKRAGFRTATLPVPASSSYTCADAASFAATWRSSSARPRVRRSRPARVSCTRKVSQHSAPSTTTVDAQLRTLSLTSASKFLSPATLTQIQPSFSHSVLTL
jgi:hypothetical protein